jgi:SAM-dependent methyltransferase
MNSDQRQLSAPQSLRIGLQSTSMVALLLACVSLSAQTQTVQPFEPKSGRPGKDVEWVPTPQVLVDRMLDLAKVTPRDYVIDLGSGDGRTVLTAASRGARAHGIEYDPEMVKLARENAARQALRGRATFAKGDLFKSDLSKATVITMFLLPGINLDLRPKLLNLKPGTRIVSNTWDMEEWEADETAEAGADNETWRRAFLWIVPARVEGTWEFSRSELRLEQRFQRVSGTLRTANGTSVSADGRLRGDQITLRAGDVQYQGRVNGNTIDGTTVGGASALWRATRVAPRGSVER